MEVDVLDISGKKTGKTVTLSDDVFGMTPNDHAIYLDVKQYLAHQRQGTHKSKERNEIVSRSTRKIKKQKGTGSARAGSTRSPIFVGGGRIFGPKPRSYTQKLNKNLKRLARRSVFSLKAKQGSLFVLSDFSFETPKTKSFVEILKNLNVENKKSIFVLSNPDNNIYLASRNLQHSKVITSSELSTYSILNASSVFLLESVVAEIEKNLN